MREMIEVKVHSQSDEEIASVWMREAPRVGEYLWIAADGEAFREKHGTTSFKVVEVAHWIVPGWSPSTHTGEPIHSVCAYVEPVS
ncbi:hypothetical protein [Azospirillum brasilense]|nr:hypothetical protein [Azospirillum brasilense]